MEFEDEVKEMIDCHQEGDYLDFKEYDYQKDHKEELVKDILALANSHSIRNKYIIIGAVEENNACTKLREIDTKQIRDEAEFQQIINTYIYENLIVNYRILNIDGKNILVIQIPVINNSNRPFMVKKQIGKLKENEIYIKAVEKISKKNIELSAEFYAGYVNHMNEYMNLKYSLKDDTKLIEPNVNDLTKPSGRNL